MEPLTTSFENVADWCERYLEDQRGQEIGMTFGAMLRAYGRLATAGVRLQDDERSEPHGELNAKAEMLLLELSRRFIVTYGWISEYQQYQPKTLEPHSMVTNMIYDRDGVALRSLPPQP